MKIKKMNPHATRRNIALNSNLVMIVLAVGLLTGVVSACGVKVPPATREAYETSLDPWIGKSSDDLKREWGLPNRTNALSDGNTLLEYRLLKPLGIGRMECITLFEVNPDSIILSHRSIGASCRARPKAGNS